jgi:hypothetical protein
MKKKEYKWDDVEPKKPNGMFHVLATSNLDDYNEEEDYVINTGAISYIKPFIDIKTKKEGVLIVMLDGSNFFIEIEFSEFLNEFSHRVNLLFHLNTMAGKTIKM